MYRIYDHWLQFMFEVTGSQLQSEVIISLEQNDKTALRRGSNRSTHLTIGLSILKVKYSVVIISLLLAVCNISFSACYGLTQVPGL